MTTGPFTTAMPQQQLLLLKIATRTSSNSHLPTQYKKQPQLLPNPSQLGGREAECYKAVHSPAGGRIWEHLTPLTEGQINAILEEHRSIALWLPYFIYKIFPFTGSEQFLFHAVKVRSTANNIFFWKLPSFSLYLWLPNLVNEICRFQSTSFCLFAEIISRANKLPVFGLPFPPISLSIKQEQSQASCRSLHSTC